MGSGMYRVYAVRYAHRATTSSSGAPELIVSGHDPLVLERLRRVADGIVEF
jgi:DNA-directed RNA polymerase subunit K/omega